MSRTGTASLLSLIGGTPFAGCAALEPVVPPTAFRLTSPQYADNAMLERKNACNLATNPNCTGQNVSPALQWSNAPDKTRSFAILMDDQAGHAGLGVSHMVIYGIPATVSGFGEGEISAPSGKYVGGRSTPGATGYFGPCPPKGNAPQHYVLTLIATAQEPGALPPGLNKEELLKALQGRALRAASLVLRFAQH